MASGALVLRDARSDSADDIADVSWALETATGKMFSMMLGRRWQVVMNAVVATSGHAWSVERGRIAEVDGRVAGVTVSAPAATPVSDPALGLGWGWLRLRMTAVALAGLPFLRFMESHVEGEWYLTAIAVRPPMRTAGVGSALLADFLRRGRDQNLVTAALDVDASNTGAERLYRSNGFTVYDASPPAWLMGGIRVKRMHRALG
ncbi:MAG: GNAT family N-acetyltransferase [Candidatus Nanopelagicales bacterium]